MKNITIIVTLFFLVFGIAALQASQFHKVDLVVYKQELSGKEPGVRKVLIRKSLKSELESEEVVDLEFIIEENLICKTRLNYRTGLSVELFLEDNKVAGFYADYIDCEFILRLNDDSGLTKYIINAGFFEGSIIPDRHVIGGEVKSD